MRKAVRFLSKQGQPQPHFQSKPGHQAHNCKMAYCLISLFLFLLQSYLWNDNKAVVEWLDKELREPDSVVDENVKWIRRDWVLRQVKT